MKSLVEADECSRPNPLVQLSRAVAHQTNAEQIIADVRTSLHHQSPSSSTRAAATADELTNEYLCALSNRTLAPQTFSMYELASQLPRNMARSWTQEYTAKMAAEPKSTELLGDRWVKEYMRAMGVNEREIELMVMDDWANQKWKEIREQDSLKEADSSRMWSSEYLANYDQRVEEPVTKWIDEYLEGRQFTSAIEDDLMQFLEGEWESQNQPETSLDTDLSTFRDYKMSVKNPFLAEQNPIAKGETALMSGNLAGAVLYFEAAVQKEPNSAKAWCMLGLSQAENEQDLQAIGAFKRALQIEPNNSEALLALSVSYANESMLNQALAQLERWLSVHPIYGDGGGQGVEMATSSTTLPFLDRSRFEKVEEKFLKAAQQKQPEEGDAILQNALGILYNLNGNYERALDSIRAALAITPNDARLWNRFGATLANADRPTEAISAYRQALRLFPAYVRARYNLGLSCMHLNSYKEAIQHLISALELQQYSISKEKTSGAISSIWQTLRSAILLNYNNSNNNNDWQSIDKQKEQILTAVNSRDLINLKHLLNC